MATLKKLKAGDRVRHNYTDGHGEGIVTFVKDNPDSDFNVTVVWDSGKGTFPYTYNQRVQEVVPA